LLRFKKQKQKQKMNPNSNAIMPIEASHNIINNTLPNTVINQTQSLQNQPAIMSTVPVLQLNIQSVNQTNNQTPNNINLAGIANTSTSYIFHKPLYFIIMIPLAVSVSIINPLFGIILLAISIYIAKALYEKNLFQAFARANNFDFQKNGIVPSQNGHIFYSGHSRRIYDVVSGSYADWPLLIFLYDYDIGYGRDRQTYNRVVVNINFNVILPTFIIKRGGIKGILQEEGERLSSNGYTDKLQLEGDFNKHLEVFIPPNTGQDVLTILTPDVMELLKTLEKYEIELTPTGDFYIYTRKYITKKVELIDIYKIIELLIPKIGVYAKLQTITIQNTNEPTYSTQTPVTL
jgi:hypothetical protein